MKRRVVGTVTSTKMLKSIRVSISRRVKDCVTGKFINRETICFAHDEYGKASLSDVVELVECKPLSKLKRWELVRIL